MANSDGVSFHTYGEEEEVWAWRFARRLVLVKGEEYRRGPKNPEFVYDPKTINAFLKKRLTARTDAKTRITDAAIERILAP
jgi:hypothetical protein